MKKALFMLNALSDYFLQCLIALQETQRYEITVIRWPKKSEAPYEFVYPKDMSIHERKELNDPELMCLAQELSPDFIFVSGWRDKGYLKIAKAFKDSSTVVTMSMDNHWNGHLKQRAATLLFPWTIGPLFDHIWVPGKLQAQYARRLGFSSENIHRGMYVANSTIYQPAEPPGPTNHSKTLVCIARYTSSKGLEDLWNAFEDFVNDGHPDWQLKCMGTGENFDQRVIHPNIQHIGFVQPADVPEHVKGATAFVLPSHFEPWGVVVQEMALMGFPLICSDAVGARTAFVRPRENGFVFPAGDSVALKQALVTLAELDQPQWLQWSQKSRELAETISHQGWVETIDKMLCHRP